MYYQNICHDGFGIIFLRKNTVGAVVEPWMHDSTHQDSNLSMHKFRYL